MVCHVGESVAMTADVETSTIAVAMNGVASRKELGMGSRQKLGGRIVFRTRVRSIASIECPRLG